MLSVITNIYSNKTKGPALMELFSHMKPVCRVTRGEHSEHL
jgi:hypothetical protein